MNIYTEIILDHFENPRNFKRIEHPDKEANDSNPLCGDSFEIQLKIKDNKVVDVGFNGHGCAVSTASASMLSEKIMGMTMDEVRKLEREDVLKLLSIELSHVRIKCAMLPLKVIKLALYKDK